MREHVPDEELGPGDVPVPDAAWSRIAEFGHRFHAYKVAGSVGRVSTLASEDADRWEADGSLPDDLTRLRLDLFATVRAVGLDGAPDADTEAWARALVGAIRRRVTDRGG